MTHTTGQRRNAYTLFELMLVMAIILILAALISPLIFQRMQDDSKVGIAGDMVRARWNDCRTQAIDTSTPYRFAVIPNTGKFKIEPWTQGASGDSGQPNSGSGSGSSDNQPGLIIIEDKLPEGVRFGLKDTPISHDAEEPQGGDWVTVAIFLPDGTAQDDVEITFGGKGMAPLTIQLRALTGTSMVVRQPEEGR